MASRTRGFKPLVRRRRPCNFPIQENGPDRDGSRSPTGPRYWRDYARLCPM